MSTDAKLPVVYMRVVSAVRDGVRASLHYFYSERQAVRLTPSERDSLVECRPCPIGEDGKTDDQRAIADYVERDREADVLLDEKDARIKELTQTVRDREAEILRIRTTQNSASFACEKIEVVARNAQQPYGKPDAALVEIENHAKAGLAGKAASSRIAELEAALRKARLDLACVPGSADDGTARRAIQRIDQALAGGEVEGG